MRFWQAVGEEWDQPDAFGQFDHLMADYELGPAVMGVSNEALRSAAQAVAEAARTLS